MRSDNRSGNVWIYPCRDGFRIYFRVGGRMNGTKVIRRREDAEAEADRIRSELTMRSRTVRSAFGVFKAEMVASELVAKTIERVERDAFRLIAPVLDEPLSALTARRVDSLYAELATSEKYLASTHQMSLKVCKQFGAWCAHPRRRWLRENPFAAVQKLGKVADHRSDSLRVNEARLFRSKAIELGKSGDDGAVAALLALITSLRPSEIVQLTARDVDDDGGILWVAGPRLKTKNTRRPIELADLDLRGLLVRVASARAPTDRLFPHGPHFPTRVAHRIADAVRLETANARMLRRTSHPWQRGAAGASMRSRSGWDTARTQMPRLRSGTTSRPERAKREPVGVCSAYSMGARRNRAGRGAPEAELCLSSQRARFLHSTRHRGIAAPDSRGSGLRRGRSGPSRRARRRGCRAGPAR